MNRTAALAIGLAGLSTLACASAPKAPFDTLKTANVSVLRLQNFEPPTPPPGAAAPQQGMIPGLPPEIANWAQMAQQSLPGLQAFIPPGLLPPGMLGGGAQAAPPAPPPPDAPRFPMSQPNFRILPNGVVPVTDPALREELGKLFGNEDNFEAPHSSCLYPEMGLSFSTGGPPNDMLISFSCQQVQARSFAWPHPNTGLKSDTIKELDKILSKLGPMG
jgi:hypothetical protein